MNTLEQRSYFRRRPSFWAVIAGLLGIFESYVLPATILRADFLPLVITNNSTLLAIVPMIVLVVALTIIVQAILSTPTADHSPFFQIAPTNGKWLIASFYVLAANIAVLAGMAATLFLCEKAGPWSFIMGGISGPRANLPENLWPLPFFASAAFVIYGAHHLLKSLRETDIMVKIDE